MSDDNEYKFKDDPASNDKEVRELFKKIEKNFKEASKYREKFEKDWQEYERFYDGEHWEGKQNRPSKNLVFTIIEGEVPILTDSRPSTDIIPYNQEEAEDAKILESALHYTYDVNRLNLKVPQAVRSALKTGTGWYYVDWDPDLEKGQGNVIIKNTNWRWIYIDPTATELDDANFVGLKMPMKVDQIKRRFPKKAEFIKAQKIEADMMGDYQAKDQNSETRNLGRNFETEAGEDKRYELEDMAILEEAWLKDYSMEKIPEEDTNEEINKEHKQFLDGLNPDVGKFENHEMHEELHKKLKDTLISNALGLDPSIITDEDISALVEQSPELGTILQMVDDHLEMHEILKQENPKAERPKYPNNLRLVIKSGNTLLYDGKAPVEDGLVPLVPVYCYKEETSIYGTGEIKNLLSPQKSFNEMEWLEIQGLRLNANSGWLVDEESGVDSNTLTNEQGIVVTKKSGTEVQRLPPGQVSPQFEVRKVSDRSAMEAISGVNEASQGRRPTGITAASAIKFLQEQSVGRIRLKSRMNEEYSMLRLGELVTSRIVKYWTTERKLRLYDNGGQIKHIEFDPERVQNLEYDVRMTPGSTAGLDKESIFTVMKELVQAQIIDPKTFFEVTDIPYKNFILRKLEETDQQTQMLEQLNAENEQLKAQLGEVDQALGGAPINQSQAV